MTIDGHTRQRDAVRLLEQRGAPRRLILAAKRAALPWACPVCGEWYASAGLAEDCRATHEAES